MSLQQPTLAPAVKRVRNGAGSTVRELIDACRRSEYSLERAYALAQLRRYVASGVLSLDEKTDLLLTDDTLSDREMSLMSTITLPNK